jgi:hypothetical protein
MFGREMTKGPFLALSQFRRGEIVGGLNNNLVSATTPSDYVFRLLDCSILSPSRSYQFSGTNRPRR